MGLRIEKGRTTWHYEMKRVGLLYIMKWNEEGRSTWHYAMKRVGQPDIMKWKG